MIEIGKTQQALEHCRKNNLPYLSVTRIERVIPAVSPSSRFAITKMVEVLKRQGQIEPLQVQVYCPHDDGTETYITFYEDVHAAEIVQAARNLGWLTLLVCVTNKYEE